MELESSFPERTTVRELFARFNATYFRGKLPQVTIKVMDELGPADKPALGLFKVDPVAGKSIASKSIEILRAVVEDQASMTLDGVLLHEMCHLAQHINAARRSSSLPFRMLPDGTVVRREPPGSCKQASHGLGFHRQMHRLWERGAPLDEAEVDFAKMPARGFTEFWRQMLQSGMNDD